MKNPDETEISLPAHYQPLAGSECRPAPKAKRLGPVDPQETFKVTLVLRRRLDGALVPRFEDYVRRPLQQRRRLEPAVFAERYGASPEDLKLVEDFAREHGLAVVATKAVRRTVEVAGTAAEISRAFAVGMGRYERVVLNRHTRRKQIERYRGQEGSIHVPKELGKVLMGVFGVDNRAMGSVNGTGVPPITKNLTVAQIAKLYYFPAAGSSIDAQTIGILAPTNSQGGFLVNDIQSSFNAAGIPHTQVVTVPVDGVPNGSAMAVTSEGSMVGQSTLTFPLTSGILVGAVITGIPNTYVQSVTNNTAMNQTIVTLETVNETTYAFEPYQLTFPVAAMTPVYFNLDIETTQDIVISAAAAQGANVAVYFSNSNQAGWIDMVNRAIHPEPGDFAATPGVNPPTVLSTSYAILEGDDPRGLTEVGATASYLYVMSAIFEDAAIQGVTVCVAAGDLGSNNYMGRLDSNLGDGYAHVGYPQSDPWVLAVGGTVLGEYTPSGSSTPLPLEYVWNNPSVDPSYPFGTTGGGVSDFFLPPAYQSQAAVPASVNVGYMPAAGTFNVTPPTPFNANGRGIPDVAANASLSSQYEDIYLGGAANLGNGTSAAAPLWAGFIALLNSNLDFNLGFANPLFYAIGASGFNPINVLWPDPALSKMANCPANNGNNGVPGYPANALWDACTGWGSPNGAALLNAIKTQVAQDCYFIIDQGVFGLGAVSAELSVAPSAVFNQAFFVVVDGFNPNQLGITSAADPTAPPNLTNPTVQPQFTPALPAGMIFVLASVAPADIALLTSTPSATQRFTYVYNVEFTSPAGFPMAVGATTTFTATATVAATVNGTPVSVSNPGVFALNNLADPYFAGGSGVSWLSNDVRVFELEPGAWSIPRPGMTPINTGLTLQNSADISTAATTFIQQVIQYFNQPGQPAPPLHPFDYILTGEDAAQLDVMPTDPNNQNAPVFNFAVARVRYNAMAGTAQSVRVFFRLMTALSVSTAYDPEATYRRYSDGVEFGEAIPLLGFDPSSSVVASIPFFATPRIDVTQAPMGTQTDPPNVQSINANAGKEVDTYFGCWLDLNQIATGYPANLSQIPSTLPTGNLDGPYPAGSLQTIQSIVKNLHECLVAEIAYDPNPIPTGLTPSTSGPLAQRNLSLVPVANPGVVGSRRAPSNFTVRPTPPDRLPGEQPDELMIDWGNTPTGSEATLYWPAVNADEVMGLADWMYGNQNLTRPDAHTLRMPTGGITYLPIPPGPGTEYAGLLSVELPHGIIKGQVFNLVLRQVTRSERTPRKDPAAEHSSARRLLGAFQITIQVSTKAAMLPAEERTLALVRSLEQNIPPQNPWYPVFHRYVEQVAERVAGLGGKPEDIKSSDAGEVKSSRQDCGKRDCEG